MRSAAVEVSVLPDFNAHRFVTSSPNWICGGLKQVLQSRFNRNNFPWQVRTTVGVHAVVCNGEHSSPRDSLPAGLPDRS
jgi:hypothetical protein